MTTDAQFTARIGGSHPSRRPDWLVAFERDRSRSWLSYEKGIKHHHLEVLLIIHLSSSEITAGVVYHAECEHKADLIDWYFCPRLVAGSNTMRCHSTTMSRHSVVPLVGRQTLNCPLPITLAISSLVGDPSHASDRTCVVGAQQQRLVSVFIFNLFLAIPGSSAEEDQDSCRQCALS